MVHLPARPSWLAAVLAAWTGGVTIAFVHVSIAALARPLNDGADLAWGVGILVSSLLILASHLLHPSRTTTNAWVAVAAAPAVLMIFLSGGVISVLLLAWLIGAAWLAGRALLTRLGATGAGSALESAVVAIPLGLVMLALIGLSLASAAVFSSGAIYLALAAITTCLLPSLWRRRAAGVVPRAPTSSAEDVAPFDRALVPISAVVLLVGLAWALAPEIQYDALNYHLAVPKAYLAEGRLVDLPYFWHSYFAQMVELVFGVGMALGGPQVAKLIAFFIAVLTACGTYVLGSLLFSRRVALWAAALFSTTPLVLKLSTTSDVDLAVGMLLVAAWIAAYRWWVTGSAGWIVAAGLLAGGAVGARITGVFGVVSLLILAVWRPPRHTGTRPHRPLLRAAGVLLAFAVTAGPWYGVRFSFTGNPFFPFFDTSHPAVGGAARNIQTNATPRDIARGFATLSPGVLTVPIDFTFNTRHYGAVPNGVGGTTLLLVPLGIVLFRRSGPVVIAALVTCLVYLGLWFRVFPHARLYLSVLPLACILAVGVLSRLSPNGLQSAVARGLFGVTLAAHLLLAPTQFWYIPERVPLALAFGLESDEQFLMRSLPPYAALQFLNNHAGPGERAIGVNVDGARFYLRPPLASWNETWTLSDLPHPLGALDVDGLIARNYRYLIYNHGDPAGEKLSRPDPFRDPSLRERLATPLFSRKNVTVYRLDAGNAAPTMVRNELANPGFELRDGAGLPTGWAHYGHPEISGQTGGGPENGVAVHVTRSNGLFQRVAVRDGMLYRLTHRTRALDENQQARLQVNWLDAKNRFLETSILVVTAQPVWARQSMYATAPAGAAAAEIYMSVHDQSRVWFDDAEFGIVVAAERAPQRTD